MAEEGIQKVDLGRPCVRCGSLERIYDGRCGPCHRARAASWYRKNEAKVRARSTARYFANHEVVVEKQRNYRKRNRSKVLATQARCLRKPNSRLAHNLRTRLNQALRSGAKAGSAVRDLGCTIPELRVHLEAQFQSGMTWENWSRTGWHIDHIRPLASFDLTDRTQFLQACRYTNLQPLWAEDNMSKHTRCPDE